MLIGIFVTMCAAYVFTFIYTLTLFDNKIFIVLAMIVIGILYVALSYLICKNLGCMLFDEVYKIKNIPKYNE